MRTVFGAYVWKSEDIQCHTCFARVTAYVLIKPAPRTRNCDFVYNYNYPCGHANSLTGVEPTLRPEELALAMLMLET